MIEYVRFLNPTGDTVRTTRVRYWTIVPDGGRI